MMDSHAQERSYPSQGQGQANERGYPSHGQANERSYPFQGQANERGYPSQGQANERGYPFHGQANERGYPFQGQANERSYPSQSQANERSYPFHGQANERGYPFQGQAQERSYPRYMYRYQQPLPQARARGHHSQGQERGYPSQHSYPLLAKTCKAENIDDSLCDGLPHHDLPPSQDTCQLPQQKRNMPLTPFVATSPEAPHQANHSPHVDFSSGNEKIRVSFISGATRNLIRYSTVSRLGGRVTVAHDRTDYSSSGIGETSLVFTFANNQFLFVGSVVESLAVEVQAGVPFMEMHDVTVRPARRQIRFGDGPTFIYGPPSLKHTVVSHVVCELPVLRERDVAKHASAVEVTNEGTPSCVPYPSDWKFQQTTALEMSDGVTHRSAHNSNITLRLQPSADFILCPPSGPTAIASTPEQQLDVPSDVSSSTADTPCASPLSPPQPGEPHQCPTLDTTHLDAEESGSSSLPCAVQTCDAPGSHPYSEKVDVPPGRPPDFPLGTTITFTTLADQARPRSKKRAMPPPDRPPDIFMISHVYGIIGCTLWSQLCHSYICIAMVRPHPVRPPDMVCNHKFVDDHDGVRA